MAGLLVAIGAMGVIMSMVLPVWSQAAKREREAELIFRGEQYMRAIELYQRQYVGAYPDDLETLVEQRFLRRIYEDPMTQDEDGEFKVLYQSEADDIQSGDVESESDESGSRTRSFGGRSTFGSRPSGGVIGVVSTSEEQSLRLYDGKDKYSEWMFIHAPTSTDPAAAAQREGTPTAGGFGRATRGGGRSRSGTTPGASRGARTPGSRQGGTR